MSEVTQTVTTDTNPPAAPGGAVAPDARPEDDLDTLLNEFSGSEQPGSTQTQTKPEPQAGAADDPQLKSRLDQLERKLAEDQFQKDIAPVIQKVRGDLSTEGMNDSEILDWMEGRAKRDERLRTAWLNRQQNPAAWGKVVDGLGRELHKKFAKLPDANATEDRAAVTAAVRGASTKAPEGKAPEFSGMSNSEYRETVKKEYGFDPGVG